MSTQLDHIRAWEAGDEFPDHETFVFGHGFGTAIVDEVDGLLGLIRALRENEHLQENEPDLIRRMDEVLA